MTNTWSWDQQTLTRYPWMVQGIQKLLWGLTNQHTHGQEKVLVHMDRFETSAATKCALVKLELNLPLSLTHSWS